MQNLDILNTKVGEKSLLEMSGLEFYSYILSKLNGKPTHNPYVQELVMTCNNYPGKNIDPEVKVRLINKLLKIEGVEL